MTRPPSLAVLERLGGHGSEVGATCPPSRGRRHMPRPRLAEMGLRRPELQQVDAAKALARNTPSSGPTWYLCNCVAFETHPAESPRGTAGGFRRWRGWRSWIARA